MLCPGFLNAVKTFLIESAAKFQDIEILLCHYSCYIHIKVYINKNIIVHQSIFEVSRLISRFLFSLFNTLLFSNSFLLFLSIQIVIVLYCYSHLFLCSTFCRTRIKLFTRCQTPIGDLVSSNICFNLMPITISSLGVQQHQLLTWCQTPVVNPGFKHRLFTSCQAPFVHFTSCQTPFVHLHNLSSIFVRHITMVVLKTYMQEKYMCITEYTLIY